MGMSSGSGGIQYVAEQLFFDVDDNDDGINWRLSDESWSDGSDAGSPGELNGPCKCRS